MECPKCNRAELEPECIEEDENECEMCPNCGYRYNPRNKIAICGMKTKDGHCTSCEHRYECPLLY